MNRLEEIKNEYLKSLGYRNYDHLVCDIKSGKSPIEKLILLEDDISEKYAEECIKGSLYKASENAETIDIDDPDFGGYGSCPKITLVNKESITNPENIILL